ncbi:nucleoside deaminase [Promineifilum sp.]|uniref:nucleoside deaminase n=1 Tax=Promineifilum sp. TaxID=2664178 RepID=UPI0035AE2568
MDENDAKWMRLSFEVAREAREKGNHPFGAVLVDGAGRVLLKGENTVVTERDCTGHAETNLLREASRAFEPDFLATCTLYASAEPCPMCAAAIFWSNVRRVVFGLSTVRLNGMVGEVSEDVMFLPSREVLSRGRKRIEVVGPVLEDEASEVVAGFW